MEDTDDYSLKALEDIRKAMGLTQAKASKLIYCSRGSWQDWMRGRYNMPRALRALFVIKAKGSCKGGIPNFTAKEIKSYRRTAGLSISDAAKLVYVSRSTWRDWERGRHKMHKGVMHFFLLRLCRDFAVRKRF
jgi:DNA-binding transcriptional regulator YiaG